MALLRRCLLEARMAAGEGAEMGLCAPALDLVGPEQGPGVPFPDGRTGNAMPGAIWPRHGLSRKSAMAPGAPPASPAKRRLGSPAS